jgi:hypothetical protein
LWQAAVTERPEASAIRTSAGRLWALFLWSHLRRTQAATARPFGIDVTAHARRRYARRAWSRLARRRRPRRRVLLPTRPNALLRKLRGAWEVFASEALAPATYTGARSPLSVHLKADVDGPTLSDSKLRVGIDDCAHLKATAVGPAGCFDVPTTVCDPRTQRHTTKGLTACHRQTPPAAQKANLMRRAQPYARRSTRAGEPACGYSAHRKPLRQNDKRGCHSTPSLARTTGKQLLEAHVGAKGSDTLYGWAWAAGWSLRTPPTQHRTTNAFPAVRTSTGKAGDSSA